MQHLSKPRFFSTACRHYGKILLGIPKPTLEILIQELVLVDSWFRERQLLWRLLCATPSLTQIGHSILQECQENTGPWNAVTERVLDLLFKEHRMVLLWDLLTYIRDRQQSLEELYVTTPVLLPQHILSGLSTVFEKRYNVKIRIHQIENPNLILGGVIVWRNTLTDFSLAPQFHRIEHTVLHETFWH